MSPSSDDWNSCMDSSGCAAGKEKNKCGFCLDPQADNFASYGTNCKGVCEAASEERYALDQCGNCLTTEDPDRDSCINQGSSSSSSSDTGVIYVIIAIAGFVLIVIAFGVIAWQYKRHNDMKRQFEDIKRSYQPMQDLAVPMQDLADRTNSKKTKKGLTSIPDDESD